MSGSTGSQQVSCATETPVAGEQNDKTAMNGPVRLELVGLGRMGRLHAANLAGRIPGVRLVRAADAAENLARENAARLGGLAWSTRYENLLEDPDVGAVVVAIPTHLHAGMVEAAAEAGKHVFCEKPICYEHAYVHTVKDLLDGDKDGGEPGADLRGRPPHPGGHRRRRAEPEETGMDLARNPHQRRSTWASMSRSRLA
jgi:hypothetical protein